MKYFYHIATGTDFESFKGTLNAKSADDCKQQIRLMLKGNPLVFKEIRKAKRGENFQKKP